MHQRCVIIRVPLYLWYYCKIFPYFGEGNVELQCMDAESFSEFTPKKGLINVLKHLVKIWTLAKKIRHMKYIQKIIKKVIGKMKHDSSLGNKLIEAVFLRSKYYVIEKSLNPFKTKQ